MSFDTTWLLTFFLIFCRASAMLFSAPLFANGIPIQVRVFFAGLLALASQGVVQGQWGAPDNIWTLGFWVASELLTGALLGLMVQWFLLALQMAGSFLDTQLGLNTLQLFNPALDTPTTVIAQFKFMLAMVVFLLLNGHHQMLQAFWTSFSVRAEWNPSSIAGIADGLIPFAGKLCLLAIQVAAPAAATTMVIDAAAGFVNKSIPQMQVYFLTAGAKTVVGIFTISLALPLVVVAVRNGVDHTIWQTMRLIGAKG